ncbi:MAG: alpha/beta hydrolase [Phycisphaeraceae bacterium]|nr:alpha/beta hydrolase [Phycisphaeraceae bacterium]
MSGLLLLLTLGLLGFVALLSWWTAHRLRRPPRRTVAYAIARGVPANPGEMPEPIGYEDTTIALRGDNGRTFEAPVWLIEGDDPEGPILIATPGWGDSRIGLLPKLRTLTPVCSRIIAWDPPGLGEGAGRCALGAHEPGLLLELARRVRTDTDPRRGIALYGWSMGAGISIAAAASATTEDRIDAVIAESPYRRPWTPAHSVLRQAGYPYRVNAPIAFAALGWRLGMGARWGAFDRAPLARRLRCPLLVIHGSDDDVCPVSDARDIDRAASRSMLVIVDGAGHNNLWTDERFKPQSASAVRDFLLALRAPTGPSPAPAANTHG